MEYKTKRPYEKGTGEIDQVSFAQQYLERPVLAGVSENGIDLESISVTCCTFRGIPTVDDF
ncbi:hypothetical protein CMI39_03935 [Candidatus Pacearchaeota archaeon]|jgi:hypothetical protein|nr:hypothetical protein [Candidatus Pacearchaeota archaeon]|tara:strand:- start:3198 stop:3380 length:183 start_codon:yes stop_codon:yes gene_type:complete